MVDNIDDALGEEMRKEQAGGLGKASKPTNKVLEELGEVSGWKPIAKISTPSKFMFNDQNTTVRIRSANFAEIKYYSSMDEEDQESIDDGITYILKNCIKVSGGGYKDLTITDKLHFFFAIRDYTMMNTESKNEVVMDFVSKKDGSRVTRKVESGLFEQHSIPDELMKYYNEVERCFTIPYEDPEFGDINIYVPTIGVVDGLKRYVRGVQRQSQSDTTVRVDDKFIVHCQYMVKNWRNLDEDDVYIKKLKAEYESWTPERLQIFDYAVSILKIGIKPTVSITFENGETERFPMSFRKYKSLFFVSNKLGLLFPSSK